MKKQEINNKLESLVGGRFTEEELNDILSLLFGCEVKVAQYQREACVKKELPFLDDQLLFEVEKENIDVDLFYLFDKAGKYYITETCFNPN